MVYAVQTEISKLWHHSVVETNDSELPKRSIEIKEFLMNFKESDQNESNYKLINCGQ